MSQCRAPWFAVAPAARGGGAVCRGDWDGRRAGGANRQTPRSGTRPAGEGTRRPSVRSARVHGVETSDSEVRRYRPAHAAPPPGRIAGLRHVIVFSCRNAAFAATPLTRATGARRSSPSTNQPPLGLAPRADLASQHGRSHRLMNGNQSPDSRRFLLSFLASGPETRAGRRFDIAVGGCGMLR